ERGSGRTDHRPTRSNGGPRTHTEPALCLPRSGDLADAVVQRRASYQRVVSPLTRLTSLRPQPTSASSLGPGLNIGAQPETNTPHPQFHDWPRHVGVPPEVCRHARAM